MYTYSINMILDKGGKMGSIFFLLFYAFDQFDHNEKMGESKMQFCR